MKSFLVLMFFCFVANAQNEIFYNDLKVGREVESNISLIANIGRVNNPQFRYNVTENEWQYSDDGVNFTSLNDLIVDISSKADIDSPIFTGTPQAPTVAQGDDSNKIATTKYVDTAILSATIPDATETVKGKIQLAGDLEGTASVPKVKGLDDLKSDVSDIQDDLLLKGDLFGPSSSQDNYIPVFDGITGKLLKSSSSSISTDGRLLTNYITVPPSGTSTIHGIQITSSQVRSTGSNALQLTAGTGDNAIVVQGQVSAMGTLTYGVMDDSVGGNNITVDFQNSKYIRFTGVDLNSVTGIAIPAGVTGAREISFFNSTNKEIRFVNDGFTTGKKLDLNTMPWIDLDVGKKISFTFNANTDKWVLDNPNDFFYSTIKNTSNMISGVVDIRSQNNPQPTKGNTSGPDGVDSLRCWQDGEFWLCNIRYRQTTAGAIGTGTYYIQLPNGVSVDDSQFASGTNPDSKNIGNLALLFNGSNPVPPQVFAYPITESTIGISVIQSTSVGNAWSSTWYPLNQSLSLSGWIRFKGKGLRSTVDIASQAMSFQSMKNHASFRFYVDGDVSPSIVENAEPSLPFISGNCARPVNGTWNCPVIGLTVKPFCEATRYGGASGDDEVPLFDRDASTNTNLVFHARHSGAEKNTKFSVSCEKRGQDAIEAYRSIALMAIKESNIYYDRDEFHTDERDTGRKWAGFSIYRKCFESPSMANNTVLVSGVSHILGYYGYSGWGSDISPLPVTDGSGIRRVIRNPSNEARFMTSTSAPVMFCIEYTKL